MENNTVKNKNCHSKFNLESHRLLLSKVRSRIKYGMTNLLNNSGFTLIELLVVVLIIGILAAVALPQYQMAVEKVRLTEALTNMNVLEKAIDVFLLTNPSFSGDLGGCSNAGTTAELDINLGGLTPSAAQCVSRDFQYWNYGPGGDNFEIYRQRNGDHVHYFLRSDRISSGNWKRTCSYIDDNIGKKICNQLQQQGWNIADEQ